MTRLAKTLCLPAALSVGLMFIAASAFAGETCDPKYDKDCPPPPPPCDPKKDPKCEPPPKGICHNIGGPRDLGANCDGTGTCTYELEGGTIEVAAGNFLGIVISASANALPAHIAHGDGPILALFDPPLHLASEIGPHRASNVECLGRRILDDPGN